jgi:beta-glucosidase
MRSSSGTAGAFRLPGAGVFVMTAERMMRSLEQVRLPPEMQAARRILAMPFRRFVLVLPLALVGSGNLPAQQPAWLDTHLSARERAHALVSQMTLEEKASQLEDWAPAIPRLGVPDYQTWNEALHGVARAGYATVFPQAIGMAATWDRSMVGSMGGVISLEAREKYNQAQREGNHRIFYGLTFWSPNINIFRDPRWGRGQETYGEDPFLTGQLGIAFVQGVQGNYGEHGEHGVDHLQAVATSKHFAVHSGPEQLRHGFNVNPSARDLEETYLPAFRATVTEGHVQSVMCAYNSIDEFPACTNKMLLKEHLRDAWGFKGFVVSDCGAIVDINQGHKKTPDVMHSAAMALEAGTDLSCSIWTPGFNTLADAVHQGLVSEDLVTQAAERLYTARFQLGMFDPPAEGSKLMPMSMSFDVLNRHVALKAAEESIVLLKNDGILPLPLKAPLKRIAVVGPTADLLPSMLGNYVGTPVRPVTTLQGIHDEFGRSILYAQGSTLAEGVGVPVPRTAFGLDKGLKTEFFATPDWTGTPVAVEKEPSVQADWESAPPTLTKRSDPVVDTPNYSVRWTGMLSVPTPGHYVFTIEANDAFPYTPTESYRFLLDGKVVSEGMLRSGSGLKPAPGASPTAPPIQQNAKVPSIPMDFSDTSVHDFKLEYSHSGDRSGGGITLKWQAPAQAQLDEAVARERSRRRGGLRRPVAAARGRGDAHQDSGL